MKKFTLTVVFFFNIAIGFQNGNFNFKTNEFVGAQHTGCPSSWVVPGNSPDEPTFFAWIKDGISSMIGAINKVANAITDFWSNNTSDYGGEGFGDETDGDIYYQPVGPPEELFNPIDDPNWAPNDFGPAENYILSKLDEWYVIYANGQPLVPDCLNEMGGTAYYDSCNICVEGSRKEPCDSILKALGDSLYDYLYKPEYADTLAKFMQGLGTDTVEKAMSLGIDSTTFGFKPTAIRISDSGQYSVKIIIQYPGISILYPIHSHTIGAYNCFSPADMYNFSGFYHDPIYANVNAQYVIAADSSIYAMALEDTAVYRKFLKKFPYDSVKAPDTNSYHLFGLHALREMAFVFTPMYNYFKNVRSASDQVAFAYATAFTMSHLNTGLVLYRKEKNETKFTKINVAAEKDSSGTYTGGYIPYDCL